MQRMLADCKILGTTSFFCMNSLRDRGWYPARVHPFSSGNGKGDRHGTYISLVSVLNQQCLTELLHVLEPNNNGDITHNINQVTWYSELYPHYCLHYTLMCMFQPSNLV